MASARPRVVQSTTCPVRELAIRELAYPRVVQLPYQPPQVPGPSSSGCDSSTRPFDQAFWIRVRVPRIPPRFTTVAVTAVCNMKYVYTSDVVRSAADKWRPRISGAVGSGALVLVATASFVLRRRKNASRSDFRLASVTRTCHPHGAVATNEHQTIVVETAAIVLRQMALS